MQIFLSIKRNRYIGIGIFIAFQSAALICFAWYQFQQRLGDKRVSVPQHTPLSFIGQLRTSLQHYDVKNIRKIKIKTKYPTPLAHQFQIENKDICKTAKKLSYVIIVHSSPYNFDKRYIMRRTFLDLEAYKPQTIRVVFLFGVTKYHNNETQHKLEEENETYRDIVQGTFIDSYYNLTCKGVMGFHWLSKHCRNAELVLKIDDDVFINFPKVFTDLASLRNKRHTIACLVRLKNTYGIQRTRQDIWQVDADEFKNMTVFPLTSCSGAAVFMTPDLIPKLSHAALFSPFFWIDDIYLFGILPSKLDYTVVYENLGDTLTFNIENTTKCFHTKGNFCPLVVGAFSKKNPSSLYSIWNSIRKVQ